MLFHVQIRAVFFQKQFLLVLKHALVISDNLLTFQSDSSKMSETALKLQCVTALRHVSVAVKYRNCYDGSVACELRNCQYKRHKHCIMCK